MPGYSNPYMAAYNGYTGTPQIQQPQQSRALNWVQGEQAARAWQVAPGDTVVLFDSEDQVIYIKTADATGMPAMKVLDFTIREEVDNNNYVTKNDLERFKAEILEALRGKEEQHGEPTV